MSALTSMLDLFEAGASMDDLLEGQETAVALAAIKAEFHALPPEEKKRISERLRYVAWALEEHLETMARELCALQNKIAALHYVVPAHMAYVRASHMLPGHGTSH